MDQPNHYHGWKQDMSLAQQKRLAETGRRDGKPKVKQSKHRRKMTPAEYETAFGVPMPDDLRDG